MFPEKSTLSIRLTEPVVPIRNVSERASRRRELPPPAVVRGLLTLTLAKPTKVSSIEVELQAKATTRYTQGAGPSRTDIIEQYEVYSASTTMFKAGPVPRPRAASARPRVQFSDDRTGSGAQCNSPLSPLGSERQEISLEPRSVSLDPRFPRIRQRCRLSSENLEIGDGENAQRDQISNDAAPPCSGPTRQRSVLGADTNPCAAAVRSHSVASSSRITEPQGSPVLSQNNLTLDVPGGSPTFSLHPIRDSYTSGIEEIPEDDSDSFEISLPHCGTNAYYGLSRVTTGSSSRSAEQDRRGRSRSRFSLGKVVHIIDTVKDRVRSRSPGAGSLHRSDEQEERGRSLIKGRAKVQVDNVGRALHHVAESSAADGANDQNGDGWVTFPGGTYTYPIFFTIPNNSPPTMKAEHGSLVWKVKAEVKRPSTFVSNMTAQKDISVVCVPLDDDSEEVDALDFQRQWEDQFQYRVHIPGRHFPVGGKIPFQLTIIPMAKVRVHSILVYLDERTEYYTRSKTQARSDAIRRATLLAIKHNNSNERHSTPILPLASNEPSAFHRSPLYRFLQPGEDENEVTSSLVGSGPWTVHHDLRVPDSCSVLYPSNRTKGSNVMVNHTLKIFLRVEKQEDVATAGRKRLYDIVVQAPIQILSCHCTPEWMFLPRYDETLRSGDDSVEGTTTCPCARQVKARAADTPLRWAASPLTTNSNIPVLRLDSPASPNHLHELLMSGLVNERGEAAPSYESIPT